MFRHLVVLALLSSPAAAQDADVGKALFLAHCAYCHGEGARGDGPQASSLNPQPKDLTLLATQNDGQFPTMRAIRRIDGREAIVAHGSPMPVFGEFFEGDPAMLRAESGQPVMTTRPVADLVAWLESVQR